MDQFTTLLAAVIPVFGIIVVGLVLRKLTWLTEEADRSLLRLTINLLYPCLILDASLGNRALQDLGNLTLAPLVGFATFALGLIAAKLILPLTGLKQPEARRTFTFTVGLYNYGFIPIPLAMLLFDAETVGVLFVHNVGVEMGLWTLGVVVLTGAGIQGAWRKLINAPLVAITLAVILNLTGIHLMLPEVIRTTLHLLAQCAIPLSLILIGATVADHLSGFRSTGGGGTMAWAVVVRLGLLPLVFILLAKILPASVELKRVLLLEAAMPSAVFPIVMAKHYGGDVRTALRVVIPTSLISLITIPLWIRFGLRLLGLDG